MHVSNILKLLEGHDTAYVTYTLWQKPSWETKTISADQKN